MKFEDIVVFVSDGECLKCDKVRSAISEANLMSKVNIINHSFISMHPLRNEIMVQLSLQNMSMPVCVFHGKVMGGEDLIRAINAVSVDVFDLEGHEFNEACGLERKVAVEVVTAGGLLFENDECEETIGYIDKDSEKCEVYFGVRVIS